MINIDNYPNVLTISCDGLGFGKDNEKETTVVQMLKKAGLKFQPCISIGEFKNNVICAFRDSEEKRELTIKFAHQGVHPNLAALIKTGSDVFLEFPPPEIFYEKDMSAMMRSLWIRASLPLA
jgi:hypothetical protein